MGLINFFKKAREDKAKTYYNSPQIWESGTASGTQARVLTVDELWQTDTVKQAVQRIIAELIKYEPVHVKKEEFGQLYETNSQLQKVLETPNEWDTGSDLLESFYHSYFLSGNAFIIPVFAETPAGSRVYSQFYTIKPLISEHVEDSNGHEGYYFQLSGNAFIIPVFAETPAGSRVYSQFYTIKPLISEHVEDSNGHEGYYFQFNSGYEVVLPASDVIHLKRDYGQNEFFGGDKAGRPDTLSLQKLATLDQKLLQGVSKAMDAGYQVKGVLKIGSVLDEQKIQKSLDDFYNRLKRSDGAVLPLDAKSDYQGYQVKGVLKIGSVLDEQKIQKSLDDFYNRLKRSDGAVLPLDAKSDYQPIQSDIKAVDAETLAFIDERILRSFGVSKAILSGDYTPDQQKAFRAQPIQSDIKAVDAETLAFIDERILRSFGVSKAILSGDYTPDQQKAFRATAVEPVIQKLEKELTKKLFTQKERSHGNLIKFYSGELKYIDATTSQILAMCQAGGILTVNELRSEIGYRPLKELATDGQGMPLMMMSKNYGAVDAVKDQILIEAEADKKQDKNQQNNTENNTEQGIEEEAEQQKQLN